MVTALTVNVHLISVRFTHSEVVCCYLQPPSPSGLSAAVRSAERRGDAAEVTAIVTMMQVIIELH